MRFHPLLHSKINLLFALALAGIATYLTHNSPPAVRFDRERIDVWVVPGQIHITGLYHYENRSPFPKLISLGLPFPVDAKHEQPSTFSIHEVTPKRIELTAIEPRVTRGDVSFRLLFKPGEEKWIQVDYVQRTLVTDGRYILKTTREWGRPLVEGLYVLHLGRDLRLVNSSYALDEDLSFRKRDFYPNEDWVVQWSETAVQSARVKTSP